MASGSTRKVDSGFVCFQFERARVIRDGTVKVVLALKGHTAIVKSFGVSGIVFECLVVVSYRSIGVAFRFARVAAAVVREGNRWRHDHSARNRRASVLVIALL